MTQGTGGGGGRGAAAPQGIGMQQLAGGQQQQGFAGFEEDSSMLAAMRHAGQVFKEFDQAVMQPVFGGPAGPPPPPTGGEGGEGGSSHPL